ncbi:MAG: hypothetical protein Q8K11_10695 [Phenylobacterium sp.]|uniref:hypothetical protein n=1 Tax=Phenylobacterium sp. TaxID=1871053 RepID=UPI002731A393|nr:hypothetical protein [Phenylobacterium sp.]MDP2010636.1 hypothetical protein [Phenylobacterium sp.]
MTTDEVHSALCAFCSERFADVEATVVANALQALSVTLGEQLVGREGVLQMLARLAGRIALADTVDKADQMLAKALKVHH